MGYHRAREVVRLSLVAALLLGGLAVPLSIVWIPLYEATSVDAILTPDELRDRKLIEVVHRTHRHNSPTYRRLVAPFGIVGALTVVSAAVGLIALRRIPGASLAPGIVGMRERPSS